MNTEKNQFVLPDGATEITIREGKAPELLPILKPIPVNISGTIGAIVEFLTKRFDQTDQIDEKKCHILIDRENIFMKLVIHEDDPYLKGCVTANLQFHPKFKEFGINSGKNWEPNALGQFFKMNRSFFPDKAKNMSLVTDLKNFTANVNQKIEREKSESGSYKDNFSGVVTSNLPGVFTVQMPIFKGLSPEHVEVEFYASVNGRDVTLQLFSPGANQLTEDLRDKVIDEQINAISNLCPDIAIIEE